MEQLTAFLPFKYTSLVTKLKNTLEKVKPAERIQSKHEITKGNRNEAKNDTGKNKNAVIKTQKQMILKSVNWTKNKNFKSERQYKTTGQHMTKDDDKYE